MTGPRDEARRAVEELAAAGAAFTYRPPVGALPGSFTYALRDESERPQCRRIIATAKASPQTWAALVDEVEMRTREGRA